MPIINSTTNFRVLQWAKLKDKRQRDQKKQFIAEGYHLVAEAHKANCLKEVITTEKHIGIDVPTHQVTYEVMERLSSLATPTKALGICSAKPEAPYQNSILLVDQIHHPGNLGTIIRNAVAFGVDTLVVSGSVDVYNQKVIQATQGMLFHINILKRPIQALVAELKTQGYQIIGTDVTEGVCPKTIKPASKRALMLGNESEGLDASMLDLCDIKLKIEMDEKCESLNVGVAAGIILYCLA